MANILLTEEKLNEILLKGIENNERYWIKNVARKDQHVAEDTIVEIVDSQNAGGGLSKVSFKKFGLTIEGELEKYMDIIYDNYVKVMMDISPEFKETYGPQLQTIEKKVAQYKRSLIQKLENGQLKYDNPVALNKDNNALALQELKVNSQSVSQKNNGKNVSAQEEPAVQSPAGIDENFSMGDVIENIELTDVLKYKNAPLSPTSKHKAAYTVATPTKFELTEDEVWAIVDKKFSKLALVGSKLSLGNPQIKGTSLQDGILVTYNEGMEDIENNIYYTEYLFKPFRVSLTSGSKKIYRDEIMTAALVDTLRQKYGRNYDVMYCVSAVKEAKGSFDYGSHGARFLAEKLNNVLYFVGKRAQNPELLVKKGTKVFNYDELLDVKRQIHYYDDNNETQQ